MERTRSSILRRLGGTAPWRRQLTIAERWWEFIETRIWCVTDTCANPTGPSSVSTIQTRRSFRFPPRAWAPILAASTRRERWWDFIPTRTAFGMDSSGNDSRVTGESLLTCCAARPIFAAVISHGRYSQQILIKKLNPRAEVRKITPREGHI